MEQRILKDPVPNAYKTSIVRVYSYDNKLFQGTLFNPFWGKEVPFYNMIQFLNLTEQLLNTMNYPQVSMRARSFQSARAQTKKRLVGVNAEWAHEAPIATFGVRILFRQNASWQGELSWHEGDQSQTFRSALELIHLMDSVLSE